MITKRSKGYVPYLHTRIQKYTSTKVKLFILTTKQRKELLTLNMFPKNKQNKLSKIR